LCEACAGLTERKLNGIPCPHILAKAKLETLASRAVVNDAHGAEVNSSHGSPLHYNGMLRPTCKAQGATLGICLANPQGAASIQAHNAERLQGADGFEYVIHGEP
jgi:hypothetical protein